MRVKPFLPILFIVILSGSLLINNHFEGQNGTNLRTESLINPLDIQSHIEGQLDLGPRIPGSPGHMAFEGWLLNVVPELWKVKVQDFVYEIDPDVPLRNFLITSENSDKFPPYLIGAHYDTRAIADRDTDFDPNNPKPVPGANDGGSGVAAIIELLDHIPSPIQQDVGFVLFDAEDQGSGGIPNWGWIIGAINLVENLTLDELDRLTAFILLDMIGDDELLLPPERNSVRSYPGLVDDIWTLAENLGYGEIFIRDEGPGLIDDHRPFIDAGIPSVDIIDFDYPEWHKSTDDLQSISAENIAIVADVLLEWLGETVETTETQSTFSPNTMESSLEIPNSQSTTSGLNLSRTLYLSLVLIPLIKQRKPRNLTEK